jgi:hypothetical protein
MPIAVTIFGFAKRGNPAIFCYAFLRLVRGPGRYPVPALPSNSQLDGTRRIPIEGWDDIDLITWDKLFEGSAIEVIERGLDSGRFLLPEKSPVKPGQLITGQPFGPVILLESYDELTGSGAGVLYVKGIVVNDGIDQVRRGLNNAVGPAKTPAILRDIIELISIQSGLKVFLMERLRIGVVDQFYRAQHVVGIPKTLFSVSGDKPDLRSREPMRRVIIGRTAAAADQLFRLHITLKNSDEILKDVLLDMPPAQPEIIVEADSHVTGFDLVVFDDNGWIADKVSGAFAQGFNFRLSMIGRVDELPPVFAGAPQRGALEERARISTTAFDGPTAGDRSGGLDALKRQRQQVAALIGEPRWSGESMWFEHGGEGQVEVITWIKKKLEKPGIVKAYIVDPFLGSNALQRVIARQGNENISLSILVSPGKVDPDADVVDAKATSSYLEKLVALANDWSERLCGQISILHIKRGEGAKQAFHDRYLSVVDQQGIPTVYLLSNSLSKAAGDWPFAISELDRINSWRVYYEILDLIEGKHADRDLHS